MLPPEGRVRVVVEGVRPEIDRGEFPVRRIVGDSVMVQADIFTDGHDSVAGEILYRYGREGVWLRSPMKSLGNDHWSGDFLASKVGKYHYTVEGWIDRFGTWRNAMVKRIDSGQDVRVECLIGANLVEEAASRAAPEDAARLRDCVRILRDESSPESARQAILDDEIAAIVQRYPDRRFAARYGKELGLTVDREQAGFSAWYEMFPRSCGPNRHILTSANMERCGIARLGFRMSPPWASTSCTCHRFIPSDIHFEKAKTMQSRPDRTTSAAPGRLDPKRAGIPASIPS